MSRSVIGGADDRLVWDTPTGALLRATQDLHMEGDPSQPRIFTGGQVYRVESMHPIADPPFVRLRNDLGDIHEMEAEHLRKWFERS